MTGQLELIGGREAWQLDDSTRDAGRRGVERAREALLEARRRMTTPDHDQHPARSDRAA